MKVIGKFATILSGVAILGALAFGVYAGALGIRALLTGLDPVTRNVTALGCITVLTAAWLVAGSIRSAGRQKTAIALREEKTATYQLLVDFWTNVLGQPQVRWGDPGAEQVETLHLVDRLLALYGSAGVIRAHTALRTLARETGVQDPDTRVRLRDTLTAVRADLGADTPRAIGNDLERLLLPVRDAARSMPAVRVRATLAPNS